VQLLTFIAGGQEFALSILDVREIAQYRPLTPVPSAPASLRGVMNLRGTVVPVIDLAVRLSLDAAAVSRTTCLLILDVEMKGQQSVVAMMVDSVSSVVDIAESEMHAVPSFGPAVDLPSLRGMIRIDQRLVLMLDIRRIVEADKAVVIADMLQAVEAAAS
jgi:purine-binding chemotaxis protein CheW